MVILKQPQRVGKKRVLLKKDGEIPALSVF
jgi:hypothetical protein